MGLVARETERRGIATVCLSSAYSITASVRPPRAVFVDFPLGHTAGKPGDRALQRHIVIDALAALEGMARPGHIERLPYRWAEDDAWKTRPPDAPGDDRSPRSDRPQYQYPEDQSAAEGQNRDSLGG